MPMLIVGVVVSVTPLGWLFGGRGLVFNALAYSRLFSPNSEASYPRPRALRYWDWFHPKTTVIGALLMTVGLPIGIWWWLELSNKWAESIDGKLVVVQLLVASILGVVAIQAFLLFQLPSMRPPRVSCRFYKPAGGTLNKEYSSRFLDLIELAPGTETWLHLRVTNVGYRRYGNIGVGIVLPDEWKIGSAIHPAGREVPSVYGYSSLGRRDLDIPSETPERFRAYKFMEQYHTLEFESNDSPRETGPGDGGVYSFHVYVPHTAEGEHELRVIVRTPDSSGASEKNFKVVINPSVVDAAD